MEKIAQIVLLILFQNMFSQATIDNEKQLSTILDTLDNAYYWQAIPEDRMSHVPDYNPSFLEKYPHRIALYKLLDNLKIALQQPMSVSYLVTLFDLKHQKKIGSEYNLIVDKIISFNSDNGNLQLWDTVVGKPIGNIHKTYKQLIQYVVNQFVYKSILKEKTKAYLVQTNNFKSNYFGYFDKEIDLKIVNAQIEYLNTERAKMDSGDAPRWSGHLFLDEGIKNPKSPINYHNWYVKHFYYDKVAAGKKLNYSDFEWDHYNDKKNIDLTIRFLNAIKDKYDLIHQ